MTRIEDLILKGSDQDITAIKETFPWISLEASKFSVKQLKNTHNSNPSNIPLAPLYLMIPHQNFFGVSGEPPPYCYVQLTQALKDGESIPSIFFQAQDRTGLYICLSPLGSTLEEGDNLWS
jgi:hypothetical protein